jgi:hypothetical protein
LTRSDKLQVCPKCLGVKVDLYLGGYAGKIYRCLDCDYVGPVIIETTYEAYESLRRQMVVGEDGAGNVEGKDAEKQ